MSNQKAIIVPKISGCTPLLTKKTQDPLLVSRKHFYNGAMSSRSGSTSFGKLRLASDFVRRINELL